MTKKQKYGPSLLITLVYIVFTLLYTGYIAGHADFGLRKGGSWWYFLKFLLLDGYFFFLLQGLVRRPSNWWVRLLLPPAVLLVTILAGYLLVGIIRLGGGDLLDHDLADLILAALLYMGFSLLALSKIK